MADFALSLFLSLWLRVYRVSLEERKVLGQGDDLL